MKRIFDVAFSIIGILLLTPLFIIIATIIMIFDGLPVFFWSDRIGVDGEVFKMPKFRTMKLNTPELSKESIENPREFITYTGHFLRKYSLDELPQIWSIMIGDMSFVGPRPALFNQTKLISQRKTAGIISLRPGLTGLAQINGRDRLSDDAKLEFDKIYYENCSFLFDLKIIFITFYMVIIGKDVSH